MSREPSAEQIEAVALKIAKRDSWDEIPSETSRAILRDMYRESARIAVSAVIDTLDAEPLTSTPEPSTTETRTEGPINQGPPPGFEYEYRATDGTHAWGWLDHLTSARGQARDPWWGGAEVFVERRLVGPPERIEE